MTTWGWCNTCVLERRTDNSGSWRCRLRERVMLLLKKKLKQRTPRIDEDRQRPPFASSLLVLRLLADSHMDATSDAFVEAFGSGTRRPDWVVTSPPYKHAFAILRAALRIARVGVAFKLRLTFLEPVTSRGQWLKDNAPDKMVVLPRASYRGRKCSSTEAWFIWLSGRVDEERKRPAICVSLTA